MTEKLAAVALLILSLLPNLPMAIVAMDERRRRGISLFEPLILVACWNIINGLLLLYLVPFATETQAVGVVLASVFVPVLLALPVGAFVAARWPYQEPPDPPERPLQEIVGEIIYYE